MTFDDSRTRQLENTNHGGSGELNSIVEWTSWDQGLLYSSNILIRKEQLFNKPRILTLLTGDEKFSWAVVISALWSCSSTKLFSDYILAMLLWWPRLGLDDCFWENCVSIPAEKNSWWEDPEEGEGGRDSVSSHHSWWETGLRVNIPSVRGAHWGQSWPRAAEDTFPKFQPSTGTEEHTRGVSKPGAGSVALGTNAGTMWHLLESQYFYCFAARWRGEK